MKSVETAKTNQLCTPFIYKGNNYTDCETSWHFGYYDWCLFPGQDGMTYDGYEICGDCLDEEPTKATETPEQPKTTTPEITETTSKSMPEKPTEPTTVKTPIATT